MPFEPLRPFQRRFLKGALAPEIDLSALSIPRGNGKSWLAAHILTRALTPGDVLNVPGSEYLLCAASIEQARIVFRFIREHLEPTGEYRFLDSSTRIGVTHISSNTKLRILSSNGKTAMGIVGCPLLVADEPGSWEVVGGALMWDAITTSMGKPNSPLRVIIIGTIAPSTDGWWADLIADGSHGSVYVQSLQGDRDKWDSWKEIKRVNPLTSISKDFRRKLRAERDAGYKDSRLKARFCSYRLNIPSADESEVLLTVDDYKAMCARDVDDREGRPLVAVDLGGGRAWSAAVAVWQSGRMEALALAPGLPDLQEQERRDRVSPGSYGRLVESGLLQLAEGLHVQPPSLLWAMILEKWGQPVRIILDRFRLGDMQDAVSGACPLEPRVTRWAEAAADIRALRRGVLDGPLSLATSSRALIEPSLAVSRVKNDDAGNTRLEKRSSNNTGRDDVAVALVLAAGGFARATSRPESEIGAVVV